MSATINYSLGMDIRNVGTKSLSFSSIIRYSTSISLSSSFIIRRMNSINFPAEALIQNTGTKSSSISVLIRNQGGDPLPVEVQIRNTDVANFSMEGLIRNYGTCTCSSSFTIRKTSTCILSLSFIPRYSDSKDFPISSLIRNAGSKGFPSQVIVRHSTSLNRSFDLRVRHETSLWAKPKSVHIRLGIDEKDIKDLELEDFIREGMVDTQAELDLNDVDYSTWTNYSLVPSQVRIAVMYAAIEILVTRKLESFKSKMIPSMGPMRYEVIERDASKAIDYFRKKKELALEKYVRYRVITGGKIISSSTEDEEPVFDMKDLEDKATGLGGEESWFHWLLGR